MSNFERGPDTTKPYHINALNRSVLPGYQNAYFEFLNLETGSTKIIGFMVSPNSVSMNMSGIQQVNRTSAGWSIMRSGKNMQSISLTGYMMDSKYCQERHDFLEKYYKEYVEDKKNASNEYFNDWSVSLVIEGRKYIGYIQSMTMQKSSMHPFLYQYSLQYMSIDDILVYTSSESSVYKQSPRASQTPNFVSRTPVQPPQEVVTTSVSNLVNPPKVTTMATTSAAGLDLDNERRYLRNLVDTGTPGEKIWALQQAEEYGISLY